MLSFFCSPPLFRQCALKHGWLILFAGGCKQRAKDAVSWSFFLTGSQDVSCKAAPAYCTRLGGMKSKTENVFDWNPEPGKFFRTLNARRVCVCVSVVWTAATFSISVASGLCTHANSPSGETGNTNFLLRQESERRTGREGARDRQETGIWNLLASSFEH